MHAGPDAVAILALGMVTPAGDGADASCAAIRAGIARFAELPEIAIERAPVVGVSVRGVTDGLTGLDRFSRLAGGAVREVIESASLTERDLAAAGLYVALPSASRSSAGLPSEGRPGLDERLAADLARRVGEACAVDFSKSTRVFPFGHAGALAALVEAFRDLASRRVPRAIVGGVDSLVEPATLGHFHAAGRLKHGDRAVGLIPGEAAAFFLLERLDANPSAADIIATLEAPTTTTESVTVDVDGVCDASGLTEAARRTLAALADGGASLGLAIGDLNGEPYRSEEYGYFAARALAELNVPYRLWHPADTIGDTGAASAAVSIAVGARALHRGYARTQAALVFASSDGGLRGTTFLRARPSKG
jgi:3-oxoacyl-[acyl-carrier-protein] synthase-1